MKSVLVVIGCVLFFASCQKSRTCQCEVHNNGGQIITQQVLKGTKSNTKVECEAIKVNLQAGTSDYVECGIQ